MGVVVMIFVVLVVVVVFPLRLVADPAHAVDSRSVDPVDSTGERHGHSQPQLLDYDDTDEVDLWTAWDTVSRQLFYGWMQLAHRGHAGDGFRHSSWVNGRAALDRAMWRCNDAADVAYLRESLVIVAGAQKAGTSKVFDVLARHPDIFHDRKEWHVMDSAFVNAIDGKASLLRYLDSTKRRSAAIDYSLASPGKLRDSTAAHRAMNLDTTPDYSLHAETIDAMKCMMPTAKVIVILREPVSRAWSHYKMVLARTTIGVRNLPVTSFERFAERDIRLIEDCANRYGAEMWRECYSPHVWNDSLYEAHAFVGRGLYYYQLEHLFRNFPRENVLVVETRRLSEQSLYDEMSDFLGISHHSYGREVLEAKIKTASFADVEIPPHVGRKLRDFFAPYNRKLFTLLGIPAFSGW